MTHIHPSALASPRRGPRAPQHFPELVAFPQGGLLPSSSAFLPLPPPSSLFLIPPPHPSSPAANSPFAPSGSGFTTLSNHLPHLSFLQCPVLSLTCTCVRSKARAWTVCLDGDRAADRPGLLLPLAGLSQFSKSCLLRTGAHLPILLGCHQKVQYLKLFCEPRRARDPLIGLEGGREENLG